MSATLSSDPILRGKANAPGYTDKGLTAQNADDYWAPANIEERQSVLYRSLISGLETPTP